MKNQIFRLGKNSMIYGVGTMITKFISLLLLPLFTAYLTPEDYGILSLLAILSMVMQPLFGLGLSAAMGPSYFERNDPIRKSQTTWTAFLILLASVSVLVSIAWIFPEPLSLVTLQSADYEYLVSLTLTSCAFSILSTPFKQRIQFDEKAKIFVAITLISAFVTIVLSVVAVVFLDWGVEGIVITQLVGQALTFFMFFALGVKGTSVLYSKPIRNELLRIGIPLVPGFTFLFILMQSNRYILQWFEGLERVGLFSIGFNFGMVLNLVVGAFATSWYPFFMSYLDKQAEASDIFGKIFTYYVFFVGYCCLCFFIFAKPLIMFMTEKAFHDSYQVVGFASGAIFFSGIYNLLLPGMYFRKEVSAQSIVQGLAAVLSIPLNILLISSFGVLGAALGLLFGYLMMAFFTSLWNIYRKSDYIRIKYQWKRLTTFSITFLVIPFLSLSIPPQTIKIELIISLTLMVLLTGFLYLHFNSHERAYILSLSRKLIAV